MQFRKAISLILCAMMVASCLFVTANATAIPPSDWTPPAPLDPAGSDHNSTQPCIAMNEAGDAIAAWIGYVVTWEGISSSVYVMLYSGGSWGPVETVSAPGTQCMEPSVAMNDHGDAIVAWIARTGPDMVLQAIDYVDGEWGTVQDLSPEVYQAANCQAVFGNGGYGAVAMIQYGYTDSHILVATYSGGTWSSAEALSSHPGMNVGYDMAMNEEGDLVIAWESYTGDHWTISAAFYVDGDWTAPEDVSPSGVACYEPTVAIRDYSAFIAFEDHENDKADISLVTIDIRSGFLLQSYDVIDDVNVFYPELAISQGILVLGWIVQADNYYCNVTVITGPSDAETTRCGIEGADAGNLVLGTNEHNEAVAMWQAYNDGSVSLYASVYSSGAWGPVSVVCPFEVSQAKVALGGDGHAIAVWSIEDNSSGYLTESAFYSVYNPPHVDPSVTIGSPGEGFLSGSDSVLVEWSGSHVDHYTMSVNGEEPVNMGMDTSATLVDLEDGEYNVNITAYGTDGGSAYAEVNFTVDTTAPSLNIIVPAVGAWYNASSLNATWTAFDKGSGIKNASVSVDGGEWMLAEGDHFIIGDLEDGAHIISVRVYDNAGNSRTSFKPFYVQTSLPVLDITAPSSGALLSSRDVTVIWTGSSNSTIGRYWLSVDDGPFLNMSRNTSYLLTGLADGEHSVTLRAEDLAGNWNSTFVEFEVDATAPVVTITSPDGDMYTTERDVTVEWTILEEGSGIDKHEYSLDDGDWTSIDDLTLALTDLEDGVHVFKVRVTDMAGNVGEASVNITVDNTPPTATIAPSGNGVSVNAQIVVTFSERMNESSVTITIDGVSGTMAWDGNVATFTPSASLAYNTEYAVAVSGKDLAGNEMTADGSFRTMKNEGSVSGTINGPDGKPLANATVTLSNGMSTTTDADGRFELKDVPAGTYTMNITKDGYLAMTKTVTVSAGQATAMEAVSLASAASSGDNGLMLGIVGVAVVALLAAGFIVFRYKRK